MPVAAPPPRNRSRDGWWTELARPRRPAAPPKVVPILVPVGHAYGIHPVHLGILFLANMELGFLAPPVGINLLLASYRFKKPIAEVTRAAFPMLVVLLCGVVLITYVPWLTTWLPSLLAP